MKDEGVTSKEDDVDELEEHMGEFNLTNDAKQVNIDTENVLHIEPDEGDPSSSSKAPSHLTEQGYFDLKFYHNKLW